MCQYCTSVCSACPCVSLYACFWRHVSKLIYQTQTTITTTHTQSIHFHLITIISLFVCTNTRTRKIIRFRVVCASSHSIISSCGLYWYIHNTICGNKYGWIHKHTHTCRHKRERRRYWQCMGETHNILRMYIERSKHIQTHIPTHIAAFVSVCLSAGWIIYLCITNSNSHTDNI